jgi:similar to spore coat protein
LENLAVTTLSAAVAEAVSPQIRDMIRQQLDKAVTEQFELSDMLINMGWYPAYDEPMEQIKKVFEKYQNI